MEVIRRVQFRNGSHVVTIPIKMVYELGLEKNRYAQIILVGDHLVIKPIDSKTKNVTNKYSDRLEDIKPTPSGSNNSIEQELIVKLRLGVQPKKQVDTRTKRKSVKPGSKSPRAPRARSASAKRGAPQRRRKAHSP